MGALDEVEWEAYDEDYEYQGPSFGYTNGVYAPLKEGERVSPAIKKPKKRVAAKKAAPKPEKHEPNELELLLKSIVEEFPNDPTGPGVSLAWLDNEKVFYCSIVRFGDKYANNRRVVYAYRSPYIFDAMARLLEAWKVYTRPARSATEQLLKFK
jgi:hypothetical protein